MRPFKSQRTQIDVHLSVVSFTLPLTAKAFAVGDAAGKTMNKGEVDAWLVVGKDGTVAAH